MTDVNRPIQKLRYYMENIDNKDEKGVKVVRDYLRSISSDIYKKKEPWTVEEEVTLKCFLHIAPYEEIVEFLMCSNQQLAERIQMLGLGGDGNSITAADMELFARMVKTKVSTGEMSMQQLCDIFEVDLPAEGYKIDDIKRRSIYDALNKVGAQNTLI